MNPARHEGLLRVACEYYRASLKESREARELLTARGVRAQTAQAFDLGYAPPGPAGLRRALRAPEQELLAAGLFARDRAGRVYPVFRDRLIYPIRDREGRIRGFAGRRMRDGKEAGPKYVNSPETDWFNKSALLYGMDRAKEGVRQILVEGYMDVIALEQAGIQGALAGMGTALTVEQARHLAQARAPVVIMYDADWAGKGAAMRALDALIRAGTRLSQIRVQSPPEGMDPDEWIRKEGATQVAKRIESAPEAMGYLERVLMARIEGGEPLMARVTTGEMLLGWGVCLQKHEERRALEDLVARYLEMSNATLRRFMASQKPAGARQARVAEETPRYL